jgi:pyruvate/2-oxoglutarate dehydrogenase complex dihydrolipoamide dehydrogenase (E3) component
MSQYDLVVVGAGTAGLVSAFVADAMGARVLLVEREKMGGECLWSGCVPSKTLVRSARAFAEAQRAEEFGVHVEKQRVIWNAVRLRIQDVRDDIRKLEREQMAASKVEFATGEARFIDAQRLDISSQAGTRRVWARRVILATGSSAELPDVPGLSEIEPLTHRDIFDIRALPRSLAIIGGGPSGCEFAHAFALLGTKVTLIQKDERLMPREDEDVSREARRILEKSGVQVLAGARVLEARSDGDAKYLQVQHGGETSEVRAGQVLVAAGKKPRLRNLGLEEAGVEFDERGVKVDKYLRTSVPTVFACGDVVGQLLFTHVAEHQGKIAAQNALLPVKAAIEERVVPWVTFLSPEIARVGLTEKEARAKHRGALVFREEFKRLDRAIIEGETQGFCKVVTSKAGRVLGAHIVGANAGELIMPFSLAMREGALIGEFAEAIFPYPTLSEIAHRTGNCWYQRLLQNPSVKPLLRWATRKV